MSEFSDATAAYLANADYAEVGSATKARSFVTACRKLILLASTEIQKDNNRQRYDENLRQFRAEIDKAEQWLSSSAASSATGGGNGGVLHTSFEDFR